MLLTRDGELIRQARERRIINEVLKTAGMKVPGERNHMLRHTFARLWLEKYEGDLLSLRDFLGHNDIRVTQAYYGHYSIDVAVECANARLYLSGPNG